MICEKTGGPGSIHKAEDQIQLLKEDFSSLGCQQINGSGGREVRIGRKEKQRESQKPIERREIGLIFPE